MPKILQKAQTEGSTAFDPDAFFTSWQQGQVTPPYDNDFRKFIIRAFGLDFRDDYVYRATAEVTLLQAQTYVEFGGQGRLHEWYLDDEGKAREDALPTATDIAAYTDIFRSTTNTQKALKALEANAKKDSVRAAVARHLKSLYQPASQDGSLDVEKAKGVQIGRNKDFVNPYLDLWAWTNQSLEWGGPEANTSKVKISHAILPVLYHHFGCVCPSYESLEVIRQLSNGRQILDIGSGNGYWTYVLRRMPAFKKKAVEVTAVDNGISEWRTMWIADTIEGDGAKWLQQRDGAKDAVLLLVYPQVGHEFTSKVIKAYKGTTIFAASTQNANGFTAFSNETIDQWMAREMSDWKKQIQIPLPSFAGKDEALFVFEKEG